MKQTKKKPQQQKLKKRIGQLDSINIENAMVFIKRHPKNQGGKICHNWKDTFAICTTENN